MKRKLTSFAICTAVAAMAAFGTAAAGAYDSDVKTITVMPYGRQTITGWGCYPANYYGGTMNRTKTANTDTSVVTRKAAMSTLFNDMGVTVLRHEIVSECGNGDASLNTDWMDKTVAAIKMGQDAGIKDYMITSWTPPYEMMLGQYGAYRFNPEYEDLFCRFIVNAFNYITSHGCTAPIVYSFQNEPQTGRNWCRITLGQYQSIAKKMRKALDEAGYGDVRLLSPECAAYYQHAVIMGKDYSSLYEDPEFADAVGVLGTHSYCFVRTGESKDEDVYKFAMNASNFPDKERWETEFSGGKIEELDDISMDLGSAMFTTEVMLGDVMWGGMNCWMYWNGYESRQFTYPNGKIRFMETGSIGGHQSLLYGNGFTEIKKNNIAVSLGTIWKNVPPGSIVHWAWTDDDSVFNTMGLRSDIGAFEREDGTTVLVVINKYDTEKTYNINGLGGVSAKIHTLDKNTDQEPTLSFRNVVGGSIKSFIAKPYTINIIVTENDDISPTLITLTPDKSERYKNGVLTTPKAKTVIRGYVDEPVSEFTANGKKIAVADDLSFGIETDTQTEKHLELRCVDSVSHKVTTNIIDIEYNAGFINLNIDKYPESVTTRSYALNVHTGIEADIYVDGKKANTETADRYSIPLELSEGENKFKIEAVSGTTRVSQNVEIFCDSEKPEIVIDEKERTTNDWEYLISGKVSEPLESLIIDGNKVEVKPDLSFCGKVFLDEGENVITAEAVDMYGNTADATVTVTYKKDDLTPHYDDGKLYAGKTERNINIDGKLNEEAWSINHKICKQVTGAYPANNICNFGLLWDEKYLYIGAVVQDTELHWDTAYAYNNDSIEFLFNPSASRAGGFEAADKQLFSGPINGNYSTYYANKKAPNIIQAYNIHPGGYEVELAVPWDEIEKMPEPGAVFAFEIVCNDDDIDGTARTSIMTWSTENSDYYSITSDYGLVELVAKDDIRYEDKPFTAVAADAVGDETIERDGILYTELGAVCSKYGAVFYDNPNTGVVNIFTSHARSVNISEGAYQSFRDNELIKWAHPVIRHDEFYYIDKECEDEIFKGIEPFERYKD